MKHLVISEHTRVERHRRGQGIGDDTGSLSLPGRLYDRLRAFDQKERLGTERVFNWGDDWFRATQWVGVVQVPGLQAEILPKTDSPSAAADLPAGEVFYEARRNLLFMLAVSGDVPVRNREIARLAVRRAPLSETLAAIFADRLRKELLCGPERAYRQRADNLRCFKGKLHVPRHTLLNAAHRERFFCRYDEFSDDTPMNRIFRASCRVLLEATRMPATQDVLRHCLLLLDNVADVEVQAADFTRIAFTRQNERFEDVLNFCRLLLSGRSPTVQTGGHRTFSLLFDMNKVFERFVAAFVKRFVLPRLPGVEVFPQALHHKRHLLDCGGRGVLRLEPDLLVEGPGCRMVMDTKWKLLAPGKGGKGGVSDGDLYQLHAYTRRYGCRRSVLLYPYTHGLDPRDFDVIDGSDAFSGERISVRHVHLHRNLHQDAEQEALANELEAILREGLTLPMTKDAIQETAA